MEEHRCLVSNNLRSRQFDFWPLPPLSARSGALRASRRAEKAVRSSAFSTRSADTPPFRAVVTAYSHSGIQIGLLSRTPGFLPFQTNYVSGFRRISIPEKLASGLERVAIW